jgi:hypothetical protein
MTEEREKLLETIIKELLKADLADTETIDNLLEKLVRQFVYGKPHKIDEFETFMSESMIRRFQFELDMEKFAGI